MKPSYLKNIYCLYVIKLSKWLMLIMPIVALFYNDNNLSDLDIYLLQAIYSISVAVLEIPSGYMADVVGRKKTLILGSILGTVGYLIYACSNGFYGFLLAEITLGLGGSFISGADSAMLFDSLAASKHQHKYLQFEGRITSIGNFAETLAAICGGLIAALLGYRAVYLLQAVVAVSAIPASLLLAEPVRQSVVQHPGVNHILQVCKQSLISDNKLNSTILLSSTTGITTLCMAWSAQIYFVNNSLTELSITPLWVTLNLTAALTAAFAIKAREKLGNTFSLLLIILYLPATYICLGILPVIPALASLYLFYCVRGYATPVLKDFINQNCQAEVRATVLSIRNLFIRFGFAILGPAIGMLAVNKGFSTALIGAGSILLVCSISAGYRVYLYLPEVFRKES